MKIRLLSAAAFLCLFASACAPVIAREEYLRTVETSMSNLPPLGPMAVGSQLKAGQIGLEVGGLAGLPTTSDSDGANPDRQPANAIAPAVGMFGIAFGSRRLETSVRFHLAPGNSVTAYDQGALTVIPEIGLLSAVRLDFRSDLPITPSDSIGVGVGGGVMSAGFEQSTRTLRKGFGFESFAESADCWPDCSDAEVVERFRQVQVYELEDPPQVDREPRLLVTGIGQLGYRHARAGFGGGFGAAIEITPRAPALQVFQGICDGVCAELELPDGLDYRYTVLLSPYAELSAALGGVPISAWLFSSLPLESNTSRFLLGGGLKIRWVFDTAP